MTENHKAPEYNTASETLGSNWVQIRSGKEFHFLEPHRSEYTVEDIAHALSNICRFGGHCCRFYSVAQHSVHVSYLVPPHLALTALLHDASEAFILDVPRPLKRLLPDYRALERSISAAIAERLHLEFPFPPEIHLADNTMLATERAQLMPAGAPWADMPDPLKFTLPVWDPIRSMAEFLARYEGLARPAAGKEAS